MKSPTTSPLLGGMILSCVFCIVFQSFSPLGLSPWLPSLPYVTSPLFTNGCWDQLPNKLLALESLSLDVLLRELKLKTGQ